MRAKTIIAIILAFVLVIFSLLNTEKVDVNFLFGELQIQLVLLIIGTFALGVLVGILVSLRKKKKPPVEKKIIEQKVIKEKVEQDATKSKH